MLEWGLNPFQYSGHRGVTISLTQWNDSGVSARPILKNRGNMVAQKMDYIMLFPPLLAENFSLHFRSPNEMGSSLLPELRGRQSTTVDILSSSVCLDLWVSGGGGNPHGTLGALAQGDEFLRDGSGRFGLGQGRGHSSVLDEATNKVGKHRITMVALASELLIALKVAHTKII